MLLLLALFSLLTIQPTIGQQQYVEFVQPDEPYQVPMTLPFVFQQQQGIPSSYLRPLLVDFQNRPDFPELGNKPTEQLPNVAVTLPFVFNPPNEKPNSYLRPLLVDFDDEPVLLQEGKPIRQNQPAVEDLTSPLPANMPNKKPTSYLRPLLVDFQSQPAVIEDLTLPAAANSAVTVPLLLQESEENGPSFTPIRQQTNPSIPNKNVAVTLPFAAEKKPTTDADDQPAGDLTSDPISGTVQQPSAQQQQQQNVGVMTLPFFLEPIAHRQQSTHQQVKQPSGTGGAFIVRNRLPDLAAPSGVYWPLIASLLADSANQQRPLKPTTATKPWIYQQQQQPVVQTIQEDWYNPSRPTSSQQQQVSQQPAAVQQTIKQTKPWFLPVGQPVIQENGPTGYQLVRPLIALPAHINQRKQLAGQAEARRPFLNSFLQNGMTQTGNRNVTLAYGKNKWLTQTSTVYSTEIFTVTSTIKNAYCFTSLVNNINPVPSTWCTFRRKRSVEDQVQLTIDGQPIEPTQVQKILMTALPSSDNLPAAITSSIEDQLMKSEGRFFIGTTTNNNLLTFNRPTVTSTITLLTTTTEVAITATTQISFVAGNCMPICLQKLPTCTRII